jgi:hypothetical protein
MFLTPFIHPSTQQPQSRTWASSSLQPSSFAQNQQDDERLRAANQGSASQLKSLLGVKSNYEQPPQSFDGKPGWGTLGSGAGGKSLKDIMKQEEQQLKYNPEAVRPSPNSWAAKIGAASSPFATASPPLSQPVPKQAMTHAVGSATAAFKPLPSIRGMSPEMVEWCLNSMKKIIGVDFDGSGLLEVLVDLESPTDIREIISETLGSVPLSSQFATEFIKRRKV